MDSHSITLVIILIILTMLSAFFSATETAYSSLSRARIKNLAQDGNKKARLAYKLSERYDELLSTILIGNNIVNIASATLATVLFVKLMGGDLGPTIATIVTTIVVLTFGEITPKSLAKENPESFAIAVAPVFHVLNVVFRPLNFLFVKLKGGVSRLFGVKNSGGITENELLTLVDEAQQEGGIDENESELIRNAIEFNDLEAGDIFTPRIDVSAVDVSATNEELATVFRETGFSRLPVYQETIDSIVGVINEKDFHNHVYGTGRTLEHILKPAEFIPPSMKISELLKTLQRNKLHLAVIVDEFGGTEGIVTLEDILEELVGEIWDEHDEILAAIKDLGNGTYVIPTGNDLEDLFELFHIAAETEASTINGWIIENTDKIPEVGDSFDYDNLTVTVTGSENQRATEVTVKVNFEKEPEEDDLA